MHQQFISPIEIIIIKPFLIIWLKRYFLFDICVNYKCPCHLIMPQTMILNTEITDILFDRQKVLFS